MFQKQGKTAFKKDLGNIRAICSHLGNPQEKIQCIHIAGTNGKGSTAHIMASVLQASGRKVGLYTSPHYRDYRERVKINGELMSKKFVADFISANEAFILKQMPSFFEISVAMAFEYFYSEKVEVAVIETGLGGRLDSTNIITPLLSVITNISLDHTWVLGNDLPSIAGEKAGIIKETIPVVIGEKQKETTPVFEGKARKLNADLAYAESLVVLKKSDSARVTDSYSVELADQTHFNIETDVVGPFQKNNLRTAIAALLKAPFILTKEDFVKGLSSVSRNTNFIGRWMILQEQPLVIADSAHNEAGLKIVLQKMKALCKGELHILMGLVKEKDPTDILSLFPRDAKYTFCQANIPRAMPLENLVEEASKNALRGKAISDVRQAYAESKAALKHGDCLLVVGSIYVLAEVI